MIRDPILTRSSGRDLILTLTIPGRDLILTLTILALIFLAAHRPIPVKTVQTDYCVVAFRGAAQDSAGQWHFGWTHGYAPCNQQDEYREI